MKKNFVKVLAVAAVAEDGDNIYEMWVGAGKREN